MNNKPGQGPKKILRQWSSPFPEEAASLQLLTDTVNDIIDVLDARAPQQQGGAQGTAYVIGANANGQPVTMKVLIQGAPEAVTSTSLSIPSGSFA